MDDELHLSGFGCKHVEDNIVNEGVWANGVQQNGFLKMKNFTIDVQPCHRQIYKVPLPMIQQLVDRHHNRPPGNQDQHQEQYDE